MSMSTYVHGFIPPDDKFQKMLEVYAACKEAGVDVPDKVYNFFNGEPPDPAGVKITLSDTKKFKDAVYEYHDEMQQGYEVDLTKLPKDIKVIRFVNSW